LDIISAVVTALNPILVLITDLISGLSPIFSAITPGGGSGAGGAANFADVGNILGNTISLFGLGNILAGDFNPIGLGLSTSSQPTKPDRITRFWYRSHYLRADWRGYRWWVVPIY